MTNYDVKVVDSEGMLVYGLWKNTSDDTTAQDIDELSEEYHDETGTSKGAVLPMVVLSRDYDAETGEYELFVGSTNESDGLFTVTIPEGKYAVITVKPKLGFMWGAPIGAAKRYFYREWLPGSKYLSCNMEYEYHSEKSKSKHPQVDIFFEIVEK